MLESSKLERVFNHPAGGLVARCPACAKEGKDRKGNHLRIFSDGRFACVANQGKSGSEHRKLIHKLAGKKSPARKWVPLYPRSRGS